MHLRNKGTVIALSEEHAMSRLLETLVAEYPSPEAGREGGDGRKRCSRKRASNSLFNLHVHMFQMSASSPVC